MCVTLVQSIDLTGRISCCSTRQCESGLPDRVNFCIQGTIWFLTRRCDALKGGSISHVLLYFVITSCGDPHTTPLGKQEVKFTACRHDPIFSHEFKCHACVRAPLALLDAAYSIAFRVLLSGWRLCIARYILRTANSVPRLHV